MRENKPFDNQKCFKLNRLLDGLAGYVCYGATKRGQPQMTSSLADELTKGVQGYAPQPYLTECIY